MTQNLGKAFSLLALNEAKEAAMHEDVSMFHAPSECHGLVSKNEAKRRRVAIRAARAASGLGKKTFNRARHLNAKAIEVAVGRILFRWECEMRGIEA